MTISIFGYRVTIFKFEKLEKFSVNIDQQARKQQADRIRNDAGFADLKAKAAAIRAARA